MGRVNLSESSSTEEYSVMVSSDSDDAAEASSKSCLVGCMILAFNLNSLMKELVLGEKWK